MSADARTPRREFLRRSGATVAAGSLGFAFPTIVSRHVLGGPATPAPSERIRVGFIGVGRGSAGTGGQGIANLKAIQKEKDAEVVAVCDVDRDHLAKAKTLAESGGRPCLAFADYRKLLDDKSIDAVVISTPDHWHALPMIDACAAGKDVYCEKPLSLTVAEGKAMVEAARKAKRIVQTGSQQRSDDKFRLACELVRSGRLGKIKEVRISLPKVNFTGPSVPDSAPPSELDYQTWLGPAPDRPYNVKRVHYLFRFFWDYSGGQMTNFGAHHLDIAQWGLGRDESGPVADRGDRPLPEGRLVRGPRAERDHLHLRRRHQGHLRARREQAWPQRPLPGGKRVDRRLARQDRLDPARDPQGAAQVGRRPPLRQQESPQELARLHQE